MQTKMPAPSSIKRDEHESPPCPGKWRFLIGSMTLWLVLWLAGFELLLEAVKPLKYVQLPAVVFEDQDPLDNKVLALQSPTANYNVLLLGSSLAAAVVTADRIRAHDIGAIPGWKLHTAGQAVDAALTRRFHIPARTLNMGIDACMVSEDEILLNESLSTGHKVKIVFLLIAPRDFIANSYSPNSHVYKYFSDCEPLWHKLCIFGSPIKNLEMAAQKLSFYRNRGHYNQISQAVVCQFFHRPPTLFLAQHPDQYWSLSCGFARQVAIDSQVKGPPMAVVGHHSQWMGHPRLDMQQTC